MCTLEYSVRVEQHKNAATPSINKSAYANAFHPLLLWPKLRTTPLSHLSAHFASQGHEPFLFFHFPFIKTHLTSYNVWYLWVMFFLYHTHMLYTRHLHFGALQLLQFPHWERPTLCPGYSGQWIIPFRVPWIRFSRFVHPILVWFHPHKSDITMI